MISVIGFSDKADFEVEWKRFGLHLADSNQMIVRNEQYKKSRKPDSVFPLISYLFIHSQVKLRLKFKK